MSINVETREQFIAKLENTSALFQQLFEKDPNGMIIGYEEREHLKELQRRNEKILNKLKSKEFTVSVVGLEKAGKSTLGNSIIHAIVLPEYTERCTYTTTEIRAGAKDEAEIFFYSRDEFNANFQKLLKAIGYTGNADFESMTLETFNRYWSAVEGDETQRGLFVLHNGTTVEDIRTILKNKNEIQPLLSQNSKKFTGQEEWKSPDFQIYITGFKGKSSSGSVIRGAQPYAVKNVIIHSTTLGKMEHMVLYDVPGFDSPTDLHKKQTEKMLADSDAIILVTNVGTNPNLVGTQLDMLRKVRDDDGIRLNEKTFVFGNKIDMSGNVKKAADNRAALTNDAIKYQVSTQERIVTGSAKAYLESNKLFSKDDEERGLTGANKTLAEWGMEDGIETLNQKMQYYYDNDRFAVLKTRAERTLTDTEKFLKEILEKYTPDVLERLEIGGDLLLEIKDRVNDFVRESNKMSRAHQNEIAQSKPFSHALISEIEKIYPQSAEFKQLIEDVENDRVIDIDGNYPLSNVNAKLREDLQILFVKNLVETAAHITGDKQKEIRTELVNLFLKTLGMPDNSIYKDELEESANKLFDEFLKESKGSECIFNSLVERFAVNPIETLILAPFAEQQRYDKVLRSLPELFSLAVYYSMNTNTEDDMPKVEDDPNARMKLFAKILAHEGVETQEVKENPNEEPLKKIFAENDKAIIEGASFSINSLPYDRWAKMLSSSGVLLAEMPKKVYTDFTDKLEDVFYKNSWKNLNLQERIERIDKVVSGFCGSQKNSDGKTLDENLKDLYDQSRKFKTVKNKDEMISTLDTDISILRDITTNAVVKAIGLERAFISVVVKNINLIRDGLSKSPEGRKIFNTWIEANVRKIKDSEFARIDQTNMNVQARKVIVESIRQVLDKMES